MTNFAAKILKCLRKIHGPKAGGFYHCVFKLLLKQGRHLNELEVEEIGFLEQIKNEEDLSEGHDKNYFFKFLLFVDIFCSFTVLFVFQFQTSMVNIISGNHA